MDLTAAQIYPPVVAAGAIIAAAYLGSRQATKGLELSRQIESTKQFLQLVATAHGRPADGRPAVGHTEEIAALWLIAGFGHEHDALRPAARAALDDFARWMPEGTAHDAAVAARASLDA